MDKVRIVDSEVIHDTDAIESKKEMYRLTQQGRFGNRFKTWESWQEILDEGYRGLLSVRSMEVNNPIRLYDITFKEMRNFVNNICRKSDDLMFYEATPVESRVLQGELYRDHEGLYLFGSTLPLHMRPALEQGGKHYRRLTAKTFLTHFLSPESTRVLEDLLDDFPGCIVEFTGFNRDVGILNQPLIVWEVRHY